MRLAVTDGFLNSPPSIKDPQYAQKLTCLDRSSRQGHRTCTVIHLFSLLGLRFDRYITEMLGKIKTKQDKSGGKCAKIILDINIAAANPMEPVIVLTFSRGYVCYLFAVKTLDKLTDFIIVCLIILHNNA